MIFFIEKIISRNLSKIMRRFSTNPETFYANNLSAEPKYSDEIKKSLRVAIIGLPNAGKSTLINQLINRTICPTSSKVHTTRVKSEAIFVEGNTQLVFVDTPGLVSNRDYKKYQMEESFKKDVDKSLKKADMIGVVQDMENPKARNNISNRLLPLLKTFEKIGPIILILNKIDRIKKKKILLEIVKNLTSNEKCPQFKDIFMISALQADGIDDLRDYFLDSAKEKDWQYEGEIYSDQQTEAMIERMVQAKLLDELPQELPYKLSVKLEHFNIAMEGTISSIVKIFCPSERICKVVLGPRGQRIKTISQQCEKDLSNGFRTAFKLKLAVESIQKKE